jgi:hypothetical protein
MYSKNKATTVRKGGVSQFQFNPTRALTPGMSRVFYEHRVAFHDSAEEGVDDESFNSGTETALLLLVMAMESAMAL